MRAVLIATGYRSDFFSLLYYRPTPLLQVADKPMIFHILDFLSEHGIKKCDILLHHLPYMIEEKVNTGARWSIEITYHLVRNPATPFQVLKPISERWGDEMILFSFGDLLPKIELHFPNNKEPILYMFSDHQWSGWGILPASVIAEIPIKCTKETLPKHIQSKYVKKTAVPYLSAASLGALKQTNQNCLLQENPSFHFPSTAHQSAPGIWISRGVSLHPTAKIIPPVFIGENSQIEENAVIGPSTIIENNCIISSKSKIEDSLVMQKSYVGTGLEIKNSIIDRNLLINLSLETEVRFRDDFILGELKAPGLWKTFLYWIERGLAALLFGILSPVYLYIKRNHKVIALPKLSLPASEDSHEWKTFDYFQFEANHYPEDNRFTSFFRRLPSLMNVIKGEIHFVGVSPKSINEVRELTQDWKRLYLISKIGLITLSDLDYGPHATVDETYASETYYAVHMGFWYDCKLFFRWLGKKMKS